MIRKADMVGDRPRIYRRRRLFAAGCCGAFFGMMIVCAAWGDDALFPKVKDAIFARKILMDTIDGHMDAIDWMVTSNKPFSLSEAIDRADTISAMLLVFPHLFPPQSDQWRAGAKRNPARDTFASPELWKNFRDFYRKAAGASHIALEASHAKSANEFEVRFKALRGACESCHALYVKANN